MSTEIEKAFEEYWEEHKPDGLTSDERIVWRYNSRSSFFTGAEAERERMLKNIKALKAGWTEDDAWGKATIDTCALLEHRVRTAE